MSKAILAYVSGSWCQGCRARGTWQLLHFSVFQQKVHAPSRLGLFAGVSPSLITSSFLYPFLKRAKSEKLVNFRKVVKAFNERKSKNKRRNQNTINNSDQSEETQTKHNCGALYIVKHLSRRAPVPTTKYRNSRCRIHAVPARCTRTPAGVWCLTIVNIKAMD